MNKQLRCETTGNRCGTDAVASTHCCHCKPCALWMSNEMVRLQLRVIEVEAEAKQLQVERKHYRETLQLMIPTVDSDDCFCLQNSDILREREPSLVMTWLNKKGQ